MGNPYIGEIRIFAGSYAPVNWAFCNGQSLSINDYDTLYNLIGTTYGGDGQSFFKLPDLRGRIPVSAGQGLSNYILGQTGGVETVTLVTSQLPVHTHPPGALSTAGNADAPANNVVAWAQAAGNSRYSTDAATGTMNAGIIGAAGGSQPHDNMLPYQCINYIISLYGIYPPQN